MFAIKPSESAQHGRVLRVGIIGCGMVTQVVHIPTLNLMSHLFQITFLCDVSNDALSYCQRKVVGGALPTVTNSPEELCEASNVDLVMVASSDTFHMPHTLLGLKNHKAVFVEKPIALTLEDADRIIEAEKCSKAGKVFVGYMRRYAAAFVDTVKEVGSMQNIRYARVRDIIGANSIFVPQSGTFPQTFRDFKPEDSAQLAHSTSQNMKQALERELGIPVTKSTSFMWELLSGLGSHDLSAMRELLGMPEKVIGASPVSEKGSPFWWCVIFHIEDRSLTTCSCLFQYPGFVVSYESGIDQVPRFDASIEVFGDTKTVKVCIDTPFVKGLPTTLHVRDTLSDGSFRDSVIRRTYEDAYTLEMKELYECVVNGKEAKTTAVDARGDIEILGMIMKAAYSDRVQ